MNQKILLICGAFSPLVYIAMTVIGGEMRPDYSHTYHAVSELLEAGAPNKLILDTLLAMSNILGILFGLGVFQLVLESHRKTHTGVFGAACLIVISILGLLTALFFPMDPRNVTLTFPGLMHLITVGVMSILSITATFLLASWLKKQTDYSKYGTYSYISAIIILLSGILAAVAAIKESPIMGLAERVTIGASLQWTFFLALKMYKTSK